EAQRGEVPVESRIADYRIHAKLDVETHQIEGKLELTWRNRTTRRVKTLPFHLYMNGFRAEDTAWMAEARGRHRGQKMQDDGWGYVDVHAVALRWRGQADQIQGLSEGDGSQRTP